MRPERREYLSYHDPDERTALMCYLLYGAALGIIAAWLLLR